MGIRTKNSPVSARAALAAVLMGVVALGGCSGRKEARNADRTLSRAAIALDVAKSEETKRYAAPELATAEDRLARANRAARAKKYEEADRLAAESLVNINLATAKAEAARIREQIQRMNGQTNGAPTGGPQN